MLEAPALLLLGCSKGLDAQAASAQFVPSLPRRFGSDRSANGCLLGIKGLVLEYGHALTLACSKLFQMALNLNPEARRRCRLLLERPH